MLQFLFETLVFRNISHMQQQSLLAKVLDTASTDRNWNRSAIRAETEAFEFGRTVGSKRYDLGTVSRRNQFGNVFSNDLFPRHSVEGCSCRIAVQNIAPDVFDKDRVGRTFE